MFPRMWPLVGVIVGSDVGGGIREDGIVLPPRAWEQRRGFLGLRTGVLGVVWD